MSQKFLICTKLNLVWLWILLSDLKYWGSQPALTLANSCIIYTVVIDDTPKIIGKKTQMAGFIISHDFCLNCDMGLTLQDFLFLGFFATRNRSNTTNIRQLCYSANILQTQMCTTGKLLANIATLSFSRSSWAVLLLVALLSVAYVTHGSDSVKNSKRGKTGVFASAILSSLKI